jgi:urease accessory protein
MVVKVAMRNIKSCNYEFYLMQLADSFFPSGMFGLSGGLESFVNNGKIKKEKDVIKFLEQQLKLQFIPCDCVIISTIIDAANKEDILMATSIDNILYSMKLVKEIRTASIRSGQQLLNCILYVTWAWHESKFAKRFMSKIHNKETPGTYPACLGISANCLGIQKQSAIRIIIYTYSVSIIAAAIRLGIIQHLSGQKVLAMITKNVDAYIPTIAEKSIKDIWQFTPLTDIFQMRHEHEDIRMFIT